VPNSTLIFPGSSYF